MGKWKAPNGGVVNIDDCWSKVIIVSVPHVQQRARDIYCVSAQHTTLLKKRSLLDIFPSHLLFSMPIWEPEASLIRFNSLFHIQILHLFNPNWLLPKFPLHDCKLVSHKSQNTLIYMGGYHNYNHIWKHFKDNNVSISELTILMVKSGDTTILKTINV